MQSYDRKIFLIIILALSLCACSHNKNMQLESKGVEHVYNLNNKVTLFDNNLYVNAMYTSLIFSDRDENGSYYSWQFPEDLLPGVMRTYRHFKYNNHLVCISHIENGNSEIIIFDSGLEIKSRKEVEPFYPQYIYGKLLYGHSNSTDQTIIKTIDLETLEENNIYLSDLKKRPDFIINDKNEMIITEHPEKNKTLYLKINDDLLTPVLETDNSMLVLYDNRGLFYLEEVNPESQWNLMLWDGTDIQMIEEIKTDDMNEWAFANGLSGNIIIENDFFVSVHTWAEEPYLLIHSFDSKETKRIGLENWFFTEADMERYGETFSGIYYENGQIINYFFSNEAGVLLTQTVDIEQ
ncbi:hypothetical protein LJC58_06305 [Lachnospiraceae bacterium OttesenSCG-928-D06]|nr:hypothetical protein [Lachnospiraceae bacterium OttesenSCG-928-D06]